MDQSGEELRILILDDTPSDAELEELELRDAGLAFSMLRVDTRKAFEQALDEFKPNIVLADYKLPAYNGREALEYTQRMHPQIPVIMVTGAVGDEVAVELLKQGAKDYVLKDRLARLVPAIERVLSDQRGIRERKLAEEKYRALFTEAMDGIVLIDCETWQIADCNSEFEKQAGRTLEQLKRLKVWEVLHPEQHEQARQSLLEIQKDEGGRRSGFKMQKTGGEIVPIEFSAKLLNISQQRFIQCITRDITERKQAEAKIQRREQLYAALSHCNKSVLHCTGEEELFLQTCRAAVQFGGMRMAWIGLVDRETRMVRPAVSFGDDAGYLENLNISVDADSPCGHGPTGTAIRENRPFWCQDFQHDSHTAPWQERGVRVGWAASASLPLRRNGIAIGAFNIYVDEANAFDQAACDLLVEMSEDISFALDNFTREAARERAQALDKIHYRIFERLAQGSELPEILELVVKYIEQAVPGFIGSIMLLDAEDKHLLLAAAPSLIGDYKAAINGIAVADGVGPWASAVWRQESVVVEDIRVNPNWISLTYLLLPSGLLSCWSEPIFDSSGKVLGTFDIYQCQAACPSQSDLEQLRRAIHFAVIAIERKWMEERLRASECEFRTLAEHSPEMIVRYDRDCRRIYINPAYEQQTGIPLETAWDTTPNEVGKAQLLSGQYMARLKRVMESGEPDHILLEWHKPDGSLVSNKMHAVAEYDEKGNVIGVLAMGHDITELKATERCLEESRAQLRALTAKREEAREEERKRIAREIHDELGQLLNVLRLNASTLDFRFGDANADLRDKIHKMVSTIDRAILMVRNLATRLRPAVLRSGIGYALEWLVQEYTQSTGIACELHLPADDIPLDEDRAMMVFRIVQESLTNVLRHSGADRVEITLRNEANICEVEVRDNGKGFDSGSAGRGNSFGIIGMQERALILSGELDISSELEHGTVLKLRIPLVDLGQET